MGSPVLLSLKHIKLSTRTALLFGGGLLMILGLSILLTWFFFLREINALELKATTETNRQAHQAILLKSVVEPSGLAVIAIAQLLLAIPLVSI